jgi:hypothetical protein
MSRAVSSVPGRQNAEGPTRKLIGLGCGRDITTAMPGRGVRYEIVVVEPVAPSARPVESGGLCRDCFAEPQPAKEAKVLKRLKLNPSPRSRPAAG